MTRSKDKLYSDVPLSGQLSFQVVDSPAEIYSSQDRTGGGANLSDLVLRSSEQSLRSFIENEKRKEIHNKENIRLQPV